MDSSHMFGAGYQGRTLEELVGTLVDNGITLVCDVRTFPFSRHRPEMNRNHLASTLHSVGIAYEAAGRSLGGKGRNVGFNDKLDEIADAARRGEQICLLCLERIETQCHRGQKLKPALAKRGIKLVELFA